jgi:putative beta-lysine N-acetyltransferase
MTDAIEYIHGSKIQHGYFNNRVYLMQLNMDALDQVVPALDRVAAEKHYEKVIAKIPVNAWEAFQAAGYVTEALIPDFFCGQIDALFVAKYHSAQRKPVGKSESASRCLELIENASKASAEVVDTPQGVLTACHSDDAEEMGSHYGHIFNSYPFPIEDPSYLRRMMKSGVLYLGIRVNGRLVSLAAAEIDRHHQTAEMTDFATLPEYRRQGMASCILTHLDASARRLGIRTGYAIARAGSLGMNCVFKKGGYHYAGILRNNTQIGGRIESMIVWYKRLLPPEALSVG